MKKSSWIILICLAAALTVGAVLYGAARQREQEAAAAGSLDSATEIVLNGASADISGSGAACKDGVLTISSGGTFVLSGTFSGQIRVDAPAEAEVTLALNGVSVENTQSAAIYGDTACAVTIQLGAGSENSIQDGAGYLLSADDTGAALFTLGSLTIDGDGGLSVTGLNNNGIQTKGTLTVLSGNLTVLSIDDGLKAKETIALCGGTLNLSTGGDGIQSSKADVSVTGGNVTVSSSGDAIVAETDLSVEDGVFTLTTGGGSSQTAGTLSSKGLKGIGSLCVNGGTFAIDAADDALHSNGDVTIGGGVMQLSSGDDGVHADGTLTITDGTITITKSYEGLEGADILISGGSCDVTASDDGLNAAGGSDTGMMMGDASGSGTVPDDTSGEDLVHISGGTVLVNAGGDGLDSNGYLLVTGGIVLVNGPSDSANGALDYGIAAEVRGGTVVAVGASGMASTFSSASSQCSILYNFSTAAEAGTEITLSDESGAVLLQFTAAKSFSSAVVSCEGMTVSSTVTLFIGTDTQTVTLDSTSVTVGTAGGMGGGGMGGGGFGGFGGQKTQTTTQTTTN